MSNNNDYRRGLIQVLDTHSSVDDTSFFRLGILQLEVPPSDITVVKKSDYSVLQTLRAPADLLFKSGYSEYDIQVRMYFFYDQKDVAVNVMASSEKEWQTDSANNIRYIIGLYKTAPIVIIYNRFIADQVYGIARLKTASMGQDLNTETNTVQPGTDGVFMAVPVILDKLTIRVVPDFAGITYEVVLGAKFYNHSIVSDTIDLDHGLLSERLARWNAEVVKRNIQHTKEFFGIDSSDTEGKNEAGLQASISRADLGATEDMIQSFMNDENNVVIYGSIYTMVGQPFASLSDEIAHIERQLDRLEAEEEGDGDKEATAEEKAAHAEQMRYYQARREQLSSSADSTDGQGECDSTGGPQQTGPTAAEAAAIYQAGQAIGHGGVQNVGTTDYVSTSAGYIPITHRYPVPYPGIAGAGEWSSYILDKDRATGKVQMRGPLTMKKATIRTFADGQFFTATRDHGSRIHKGIDYNISCSIDWGNGQVINYESELVLASPTVLRGVVPIMSPVAGGFITDLRYGNGKCGNMATITVYDSKSKPQYRFEFCHLLDFYPGLQVGAKVAMGSIIGWTGNSGMRDAQEDPLAGPHVHFQIKDLVKGCYLNPDHFLAAGYLLFQGKSTQLQEALRANNPWEHCSELGGAPENTNAGPPVTVGSVVPGRRGDASQLQKQDTQIQQQLQMGDLAAQRMQQLFMDGWLVDVHKSSRRNTVFYKTYTVPFIGADIAAFAAGSKALTSVDRDKIVDPKKSLMLVNNIGAGFANKIVAIPVAGQSVPFYQHMGGSNINIVIEAQALADETTGLCAPLVCLQTLFAIKEQQILDLIGRIEFKPRDVFDVQTVYLHNIPLNNLGIFDVIISDIEVSTTPGSPHVYQVRISLVENFMYGYDLGNRSQAAGLMEEVIWPKMIEDAILAMNPNYNCLDKTEEPKPGAKRKCFQLVEGTGLLGHTNEITYTLQVSSECKMNIPQGWHKFIAMEAQGQWWSQPIAYWNEYISAANYPNTEANYIPLSPQNFLLEFNCPTLGVAPYEITHCSYYVFPYLKALDSGDWVGWKIARRINEAFGAAGAQDIDDYLDGPFAQIFVYSTGLNETGYASGVFKKVMWEPGLRDFISGVVHPDIRQQLQYIWDKFHRMVHIHQITKIELVAPDQISMAAPECEQDVELLKMRSLVLARRAAGLDASSQLKTKISELVANRDKLVYRNGNIYIGNSNSPATSADSILGFLGIPADAITGGLSGKIIGEFLSAYKDVVNSSMSDEGYRQKLLDYYNNHRSQFVNIDAKIAAGDIPDELNKDKGSTDPLAISLSELTPTCYQDLLLKSSEDPANYLVSEVNLDYLGSAVNLLDATTVNTAALGYNFVDQAFQHGVFVQRQEDAGRASALAPQLAAGAGFSAPTSAAGPGAVTTNETPADQVNLA